MLNVKVASVGKYMCFYPKLWASSQIFIIISYNLLFPPNKILDKKNEMKNIFFALYKDTSF